MIIDYCPKQREDFIANPFDEKSICIKLVNRIFLELYSQENDYKSTVCCDPFYATFLRQQFPQIVVPGYHCPLHLKLCKNTI